MALHIDHDVCVLCMRCIEECPYSALTEEDDRIVVGEECTLCGACVRACPVDAISLDEADRGGPAADWAGVLVYGEHHGGRLHHVTLELVGKGAELGAALGEPLEVVVVGHELDGLAAQLRGLPVDALHLVDRPELAEYADEPHGAALAHLIAARRPAIVLAGATARASGRRSRPRWRRAPLRWRISRRSRARWR